MSALGRLARIAGRHMIDSGTRRPSLSTASSSTSAYGPAMTQTMYVDCGIVGVNVVRVRSVVVLPCVSSLAAAGSALSGAPLLRTSQCDGAVTLIAKCVLRSGWSKQAKTRRASVGSKWVNRYVSPSCGSRKRCRPSPVWL